MLKLGKKKLPKDADGATALAIAHGAEIGDDTPPKKKIPLLFIIIPAAVLVLAGGGAGAFFMMQPKAEGEEAAGGHEAPKKAEKGGDHGAKGEEGAATGAGVIAEGPNGVTFYTLPDMLVNIQSTSGRPTFLKLKLTLEMKDYELATKLQSEAPRLQDMFQGFLRELRPEDLAGSAGSYQLRTEILRRVNLIAAPDKVDAVLIEEMLIS